jgi:hypothetical protein
LPVPQTSLKAMWCGQGGASANSSIPCPPPMPVLPRPASRSKLITMVSSIGLTVMPWRASTLRSYLAFCPTFSTASLSSSGLSRARAAALSHLLRLFGEHIGPAVAQRDIAGLTRPRRQADPDQIRRIASSALVSVSKATSRAAKARVRSSVPAPPRLDAGIKRFGRSAAVRAAACGCRRVADRSAGIDRLGRVGAEPCARGCRALRPAAAAGWLKPCSVRNAAKRIGRDRPSLKSSSGTGSGRSLPSAGPAPG